MCDCWIIVPSCSGYYILASVFTVTLRFLIEEFRDNFTILNIVMGLNKDFTLCFYWKNNLKKDHYV